MPIGRVVLWGVLYTLIASVISIPLSIEAGKVWVARQPEPSFHSGTQWIFIGLFLITPGLNLVGHLSAFAVIPAVVLNRRRRPGAGRRSLFNTLLMAALVVQAILGLLVYGPVPGLLFMGCTLPMIGTTAILMIFFVRRVERWSAPA